MAQGINLLPQLTEAESQKKVYKKKVNVAAIAALLAVLLIFVSLFAYQLFLFTSRSRVENEAQNLEKKISGQKQKEIAQRILVDKLSEIDNLLNQAVPTASAVANVAKVSKQAGNIKITNMYVKSDGDLTFGGDAANSKKAENLFKALTDPSMSEIFENVTLQSLGREGDDPYKFTINMDFKLKGLK